MIDLVLHQRRPNAFERPLLLLPFRIDAAHAGHGRTLDLGGEFVDRQAALLVGAHLAAPLEDRGVDHDQRLLCFLIAGGVHDYEPPQNSDLGRGKANARCLIHGRQHAFGELQQSRVDALDQSCLFAQDGVGNGDDRENGHRSADIGLARRPVNMFLFWSKLHPESGYSFVPWPSTPSRWGASHLTPCWSCSVWLGSPCLRSWFWSSSSRCI